MVVSARFVAATVVPPPIVDVDVLATLAPFMT
jgi:hypothetical protein